MSAWPTDPDPFEAERHAITRLLQARGEAHAAAIVALSVYRPDHVDNWDGGQYEATLEVPPEFYDQVAGGEFAAAISQAAEAIIGPGHYAGLNPRVLAQAPNPDWVEEVVNSLRRPSRRVRASRSGPGRDHTVITAQVTVRNVSTASGTSKAFGGASALTSPGSTASAGRRGPTATWIGSDYGTAADP